MYKDGLEMYKLGGARKLRKHAPIMRESQRRYTEVFYSNIIIKSKQKGEDTGTRKSRQRDTSFASNSS